MASDRAGDDDAARLTADEQEAARLMRKIDAQRERNNTKKRAREARELVERRRQELEELQQEDDAGTDSDPEPVRPGRRQPDAEEGRGSRGTPPPRVTAHGYRPFVVTTVSAGPLALPPFEEAEPFLPDQFHRFYQDLLSFRSGSRWAYNLKDGGLAVKLVIFVNVPFLFPELMEFIRKPWEDTTLMPEAIENRVKVVKTGHGVRGISGLAGDHRRLLRFLDDPTGPLDPVSAEGEIMRELIAVFVVLNDEANIYSIHEILYLTGLSLDTIATLKPAEVTARGARVYSRVTAATEQLLDAVGSDARGEARRRLQGADIRRCRATPGLESATQADDQPERMYSYIKEHWPEHIRRAVADLPFENEMLSNIAKASRRCYNCGNKPDKCPAGAARGSDAKCTRPAHELFSVLRSHERHIVAYLCEREVATPVK